MPSATSAAISVMRGPSAPTSTGGLPYGFGPGSNVGVISVCVVNSPRKSSGASPSHAARIALIASTISRMRAAGRDHVEPKRRSICGLICEPRPSRNRPFVSTWRS